MLRTVLEAVADEGWFDVTTPFEKTVYMSQGSAQGMALSRNGKPDTFVKFDAHASLATEAARSVRSSQCYPDHAPQFVGYTQRSSIDVLVSRAVDFRPITSQLLLAGRDQIAVNAGLEQYFRRMRDIALPASKGLPAHEWFAELCAYFQTQSIQSAAASGLQRLGNALPALVPMPQHGDLVLNNLGLRSGRRLVIFDWEDYGLVQLPGLDLFTLEFSILQDRTQPGASLQSSRPTQVLYVGRMCDALGLARNLYAELKLSYALVFRFLKRNYAPEILARVDGVIDEIIRVGG